uniref:Uncharacterized protein n=1 Tax=Rhizophora mucronata TaxID=61149 RepID=A0A2P2IUD2_RHIMU
MTMAQNYYHLSFGLGFCFKV